ncbi:sugar phosphate isomerase/epimerase [bacterium C-53]|nr:sugar phosphate isomerase/epimerase [Lachnospiraceae bacterium]NBI01471.1 sugar phosphate isomerase/epimerase [Lachnospiraceae bacterium]RKJ12781.1 sugar phosphate isomerase/epimerase [bacterium C-53]
MKLAASTNIYFERKHAELIMMEETLRQCAAAGFQYLDFGFAELSLVSSRFHGEDWQQEIQEYIDFAKELGLTFVQAHATIFDYCNLDDEYERKEELFKRSIKGAAMMKAPWIVVHPSSYLADGRIHPDTHRKNVEFLKRYAAVAKEEGIGLAVENMWGRTKSGEKPYCLDPGELLRLIEDVDCENVKVCWDVEHGSIEKLDQKKALQMLGKFVVATHISDEAGADSIHILPYLGNADWDEILGALAQIHYTGVFNFEIQHYLPGVPQELVPSAMRFAYEVGEQMVKRLCQMQE